MVACQNFPFQPTKILPDLVFKGITWLMLALCNEVLSQGIFQVIKGKSVEGMERHPGPGQRVVTHRAARRAEDRLTSMQTELT